MRQKIERLLNLAFLVALKNLFSPKKNLKIFEGENFSFNSIIYGLIQKKTEVKEKPLLEKAKDILRGKLYDELSEIKEEIKLDRSVFRFLKSVS